MLYGSEVIFEVMQYRKDNEYNAIREHVATIITFVLLMVCCAALLVGKSLEVFLVFFFLAAAVLLGNGFYQKWVRRPVAVPARIVAEPEGINMYQADLDDKDAWNVVGKRLVEAYLMPDDQLSLRFDNGDGFTSNVILIVKKDSKAVVRDFLQNAGVMEKVRG